MKLKASALKLMVVVQVCFATAEPVSNLSVHAQLTHYSNNGSDIKSISFVHSNISNTLM